MNTAKPRSLFIASIPKCGTTWLFNMLAQVTGNTEVRLYGDPVTGAEIDTARIVHAHRESSPWIAMMHLSPGAWASKLFTDCDAAPIILVRNIYDVIASFNDEIEKVVQAGIPPHTTMIYIPDEYMAWETSKKLDFLITIFVPWVTFFLNRWEALEGEKHWVRYEDLVGDTHGTLRRILDVANFQDVSDDRIQQGIAAFSKDRSDLGYKTRFNKGVVGRGAAMLSDAQKDEIRRILGFYPSLDPVSLGILDEA
ncbi:sulfotransferase domain-containing protein [Thalassobaculum salexigens]|uniref:sulfotransferase domain-containing protein n=1 Tax=Thalassobaculum salexigens TaxID=455360 RepID=UPI00248E0BF0|nr:sulfotransferase domain-containing protein [Thalassobaculum salexigens]